MSAAAPLRAIGAFLAQPAPRRRFLPLDLGRLAVFLFGVLAVTGALLALYYRPTHEGAFASLVGVTNDVRFGWLVRGLHRIAGHALVAVSAVYVVRAFLGRRFLRPGGAAAWAISVALAFVVLAFLLTGETLPWNQAAYWQTVVDANLVAELPLVGRPLADAFRGGPEITGSTVVRLFAIHALVLPWAAVGLFLLSRRVRGAADGSEQLQPGTGAGSDARGASELLQHGTAVRFADGAGRGDRDAVAAALTRLGFDPAPAGDALAVRGRLTREAAAEIAAMPGVADVAPDDAAPATRRDAILAWVAGAAAVLGVLVALTANLPAPLGAPADPLRTVALRPSWPLLAWYAAEDRLPAWVPVPLLFLLASLLLLAWPLVGRRLAEKRPALHAVAGVAAIAVAASLALLELGR